MSDQFSFRTSDGTSSASDILSTQGRIGNTLSQIDSDLAELHPQWEASESDMYQEIMSKWQEGAEGLRGVLTQVREVLQATNNGNTEVRTAIQAVLDETS